MRVHIESVAIIEHENLTPLCEWFTTHSSLTGSSIIREADVRFKSQVSLFHLQHLTRKIRAALVAKGGWGFSL